MKRKNQKYIILIVVMVLLFLGAGIGGTVVMPLKNKALASNSLYIVFILQFLVYCFAGMIFGIENFIAERNRIGCWKINWSKILIMGAPSFIIGIFNVMFYIFYYIPPIISRNLITYNLFVNFMQMLFGYIIISSFYKSEEIP